MLTQEIINSAKEWDILASGIFENSPDGVYLTDDEKAKKQVSWVAVRWHIPDWAVYYEDLFENMHLDFGNPGIVSIKYEGWTNDVIAKHWHKLYKSYIKKILQVDQEALKSYRE